MEKTVLAIFADTADEVAWLPFLADVQDVLRIVYSEEFSFCLQKMKGLGITPRLCIISRKLYPTEKTDIVNGIKRVFPDCEFLIIADVVDPSPPLRPFIADMVRHLVIKQDQEKGTSCPSIQLPSAIRNVASGAAWRLENCLNNDFARIEEYRLYSSNQKEDIINRLTAMVGEETPELALLAQKAALLADEMLENALYGAPRDKNGAKIYQKGEKRLIPPTEEIIFRYGFDDEILALEISDCWGSLFPEHVLEHLAVNQEQPESLEEIGGRGLFIIWRFLDHLHISIDPGKRTIIGGHMHVHSASDPFQPKGFNITSSVRKPSEVRP